MSDTTSPKKTLRIGLINVLTTSVHHSWYNVETKVETLVCLHKDETKENAEGFLKALKESYHVDGTVEEDSEGLALYLKGDKHVLMQFHIEDAKLRYPTPPEFI
jgi:hypothetical protein